MLYSMLFILLQTPDPESHILFMSDRIYTVLGVVLILWLGVLWQLFRMGKRLSRVERDQEKLKD